MVQACARLSVSRLSVTLCVVAERYVLPKKKCLRKQMWLPICYFRQFFFGDTNCLLVIFWGVQKNVLLPLQATFLKQTCCKCFASDACNCKSTFFTHVGPKNRTIYERV